MDFRIFSIKSITIFTIIIFSAFTSTGQAYYINDGSSTMYYDNNKNAFFSYSGIPLGYLKREDVTNKLLIYTFSGTHVGWLKDGKIYNADGEINSFTRESGINVYFKEVPIKMQQQQLPIKDFATMPMNQPYLKSIYSSRPIFSNLTQEDIATNYSSVYDRPRDYKSKDYNQYRLPVEAITNAYRALTQRHNQLTSQGYVLDPRTGEYKKPEDLIREEKEREEAFLKSMESCMIEAEKRNEINFSEIKKGWYKMYGYIDERGCTLIDVRIQKNAITWIKVPNSSGYELFELSEPLELKGKMTFKQLAQKKTWTAGKIKSLNAMFFFSLGIFSK